MALQSKRLSYTGGDIRGSEHRLNIHVTPSAEQKLSDIIQKEGAVDQFFIQPPEQLRAADH